MNPTNPYDTIQQLRQRVAELEKERDELIEVKAAENASWNAGFNVQADQIAKLIAERDKATQYWQIAEGRCDALKQQKDELLVALENLLPWVVTQTVACNGMKCRELVCISCTDESDAEQYAQEACDRYQDAKQAIASVKEK